MNENKIDTTRKILFLATAIATVIYLGWRAIFTLPFDFGLAAIILGLLLWVSEFFSGFESVEQYLNMADFSEPELPEISPAWFPHVDVLVITHNEDEDIIYKTVNACQHMDYPDRGKVHIYICDDTDRPEMKRLAGQMGVGYLGFAGNQHAKAGNMNHAIDLTGSPLITTFDADMIPRSNFLMETVPFFFLPKMTKTSDGRWIEKDPADVDPQEKIGFIQAPQSFYNADLFQFNLYSENRIPNEQDYFFREINVGRNRSNSALFVGSNAVFSREALKEVGGVAVNTITEDFETGIRIQAKGYRTYAISKSLAHGLAPHTIANLVKQRDRWARGCIQSLRNVRPFFRKGLSLAAKTSYFSCLVYWWTFTRRFIYIIVPVVAAIFKVQVVDCTLIQILIFWLPYYILINQSLKSLSGNIRSQHWNNLFDTIMCPYLILPILAETLGFSNRKFVVTSKKRKDSASDSPGLYALPHAFLLAASVLALAVSIFEVIETSTFYNIIIIFWLVHNIKNLAFSIFFMLGRTNYRKSDRFYVSLPVEIEDRGRTIKGRTSDLSETGLAVELKFPFYLSAEEEIKLRVKTDRYQAEMQCQVQHVDPPKEGGIWRYCFQITKISDDDRRAYYQAVYDRVHTLPRHINRKHTIFDDLKNNVEKRVTDNYEQAIRKYPRIPLNAKVHLEDGAEALLQDFNYRYVWLKGGWTSARDNINVQLAPGVILNLVRSSYFEGLRLNGFLYYVANIDELMATESFKAAIKKMVADNSFLLKKRPA